MSSPQDQKPAAASTEASANAANPPQPKIPAASTTVTTTTVTADDGARRRHMPQPPTKQIMLQEDSSYNGGEMTSSSEESDVNEDGSLSDIEDGYMSSSESEDDILDPSTAIFAAMTTGKQIHNRKPILLGINRGKGTMNVQLPSGRVICVDDCAFPFLEKNDNNSEEGTEGDPSLSSSGNVSGGGVGRFKKNKTETNKRLAHQQTNDLTAAATTKSASIATTSRQTMAASIPTAASGVFSIFDRRVHVNHLSETATNYDLLRAWVQDDPYRVPPARKSEDPAFLTMAAAATARRRRKRQRRAGRVEPPADTAVVAAKETSVATAVVPMDVIAEIQRAVDAQRSSEKVNGAAEQSIQGVDGDVAMSSSVFSLSKEAAQKRKAWTRRMRQRDAEIVAGWKRDGMFT